MRSGAPTGGRLCLTRYASQPKVVVLVHPAGVGYTLRRQTGALERVANVHGVSVTTKARTTPGFLYLTLTDPDSAVGQRNWEPAVRQSTRCTIALTFSRSRSTACAISRRFLSLSAWSTAGVCVLCAGRFSYARQHVHRGLRSQLYEAGCGTSRHTR